MNTGYNGFQITSNKMKKVYAEVAKYARHGQNCVLLGPTGAGKEFLARHYLVHYNKYRNNNREMVSINCGSLSPELAESELFGHNRGAFSGSYYNKPGLFEISKGGILFLDEIGDLHPKIQASLLRATESGTRQARRLGSLKSYDISDVVIIGATEMPKESLRGAFLNRLELQVDVPGLDDRPEDLPNAVKFFIEKGIDKRIDKNEIIHNLCRHKASGNPGKHINGSLDYLIAEIADEILPTIYERSWPGNFRALRVTIDSAIIQIDRIKNKSDFISDFKYYFFESIHKYSKPKEKSSNSEQILIENSQIQNAFYEQLHQTLKSVFPSLSNQETRNIAQLFYDYNEKSFSREEFQNYMNYSVRTAQTRLKILVENNILNKKGSHKLYFSIKEEFAKTYLKWTKATNDTSSEETSETKSAIDVNHDIMQSLINKSSSIFLACDSEPVKNEYVQYIKTMATANRQFLYFTLTDKSIRDIINSIDKKSGFIFDELGISLEKFSEHDLAKLSRLSEERIETAYKPSLIVIDHLEKLKQNDDIRLLQIAMLLWKKNTFILLGDKMHTMLSGTVEYWVDK